MTTPVTRPYVLVTAARDEAEHIEETIRAVLAQTVTPVMWIVVDDRSSDHTADIVRRYVRADSRIRLRCRGGAAGRSFASKALSISEAVEDLAGVEYDYIGMLDADVTFAPDYFARLLQAFEEDKLLGVAGGHIREAVGSRYRPQLIDPESVAGAVQTFRRACFLDIGGYRPLAHGGIDALAEVMARMHGWHTRTLFELAVYHHRLVIGESGNAIRARVRQGRQFHGLGYHPLFTLSKAAYRLFDKPYGIGAAALLWGYVRSAAAGTATEAPVEVQSFLRNEQLRRLRCVFQGDRPHRRPTTT